MYDSWGTSWGATSAWGVSWIHPTVAPIVVVIDTHDGEIERIKEFRKRRDELHEDILRAYEDVTGETKTEVVQILEALQEEKPTKRFALKRIKEQVYDYQEINRQILSLSQKLQAQEREIQDIMFIASIL